MAVHDELFTAWLCEIKALRFVGYTSRRLPRRIRDVPLTRDECNVYVANCELETGVDDADT